MTKTTRKRNDALKVATSLIALTLGAGLGGQAAAQSAGDLGGSPTPTLDIVANHEVPIGPGGTAVHGSQWGNSPNVLDPLGEVNGVGQQIALVQNGITTPFNPAAPPGAVFLSLCSGTLINPRTVITAAHCVYNNPAHMYGSDTGTGGGLPPTVLGGSQGIPLSFGFSSTNRCLGPSAAFPTGNGCAVGTGPYERWRDTNFTSQPGLFIYNANQVWYNTNSQPVALGGGGEFANGDIALITFDTHINNVPTWTLLFSPLDGPTHATITGYGGTGVGLAGIGSLAGIDYRRRSAENMIDALMTNHDWVSSPAINPGNNAFIAHQHPIYWMDFDDPDFNLTFATAPASWCGGDGNPNPRNWYCDFNGLGGPAPNGAALPNEGATAGGDSGGPLVIDQRWDIPVVAGVLTGSWSFNGGVSTYGQFNVYPPLFQFWEQIVENNPYIYAGSRAGIRDWTNPAHWVQLMDPNYAIIGPDGELVNSVPDTPEGGGDGPVDRFGTLCFFDVSCTTFDGPGNPVGSGTPLWTPATNFVPDNVEPINSATPGATVRARYYDVTLAAIGETRVTTPITIDRLTLDGALTSLDVRSTGTLNVWGDFTVGGGFLNVDGQINSGEALLVHGLLTGRGTFNPTFLTSVDGVIAPGSLTNIGTLSVQGDVVLASNTDTLIQLGRTSADQLRVLADPAQGTTGNISLGGDLWLTPHSQGGGPRHNNVYTIVLADGSVVDTFDDVNGFLGVLRPELTYLPNSVRVKLKAGSFLDLILHNPALMPFALALDQLRETHYNSLYDLYGEIDLMDPTRLSAAFSSLAPGSLMDAHGLIEMQQSSFGMTLQDRMSFIARTGAQAGALSVSGNPGQVLSFGGDGGLGAAGELSFASMLTDTRQLSVLPGRMSAFFSGGYGETRASSAAGRSATRSDDGLRTWNMVGGVEHTMEDFTLGIAAGYSRGASMQATTSALAENDLTQTAVYGVYRFDDGLYLSGMVGAGSSRSSTERRFIAGSLDYNMQGDVEGDLFLASLEAGVNIELNDAMTLTPNFALRQYTVRIRGFEESGGAETALTVDEQVYERSEARLGLRLAGEHAFDSGWRLVPSLDAAVVSNLSGEDAGGVWARFTAAPDVPFYLPGMERDDVYGQLQGGLRLVRGDTSFALQFESSVEREELYEDRYMARYAQRF